MSEALSFVILGLGTGALYAVMAQGLVLIYRASGIVNFSQGALATLGGYSFYELTVHSGLPVALAIPISVLLGGLTGVVMYLVILRPINDASPITKIVATLGVLVTIQSIAILHYADEVSSVPSFLPTNSVDLLGAHVGVDRIILFGFGAALTAVLWAVYRYTAFGRVTSATAENQMAVSSLGHSPDWVAGANWFIGAALGALGGVLLAPITFLSASQFGLLILPVTAAAVLGGFSSFPLAFLGAAVIGVTESLATRYIHVTGASSAVPFIAVSLYLVIRGHGLPLRGHVFDRFAAVGTGRVRPIPTIVVSVLVGVAILTFLPLEYAVPLAVTLAGGCLCLSVVVLTGFAGQISLAQMVLGGAGAFAAAKLAAGGTNLPFILALLAAIVVTTAVGAIVGIPALRTRGINLAISTLGSGVAIYVLVLNNPDYNGGLGGVVVPSPSIFGWSIDPLAHPRNYTLVAFVLLILIALMVANIRRGAVGRRLLAVRSNERAAAALGVSVYGAKLYAFMVAAGIAAVGGCLLAFLQSAVVFGRFEVFVSISLVTVTVVGGVATIAGGLLGALLLPNGIVSQLFSGIHNINAWLPLIGGVSVLYAVRAAPDGIFELNRRQLLAVGQAMARRSRRVAAFAAGPLAKVTRQIGQPPAYSAADANAKIKVDPATLAVEGLTVRYGGIVAVDGLSLKVQPGRVHGLIGPNGAGKTTVIDALTGFAGCEATSLRINDREINGWSPQRRLGHGLSRSFQAGELFGDLTVRENLAVACDDRSFRRYFTDLVRPGKIELTPAAIAALTEFELGQVLDETPLGLPFGRRKLVAIARAVAAAPSILLLDEPAAGLDSQEADELADLIKRLAHDWGIAVLLVEHNVDMVLSVCDEITVMANGRPLLEAVPPDVVRSDPQVLEVYLGDSGGAGTPPGPASLAGQEPTHG